MLISSAAFFGTLYARPDLRGLSVACAWMLAIGDLLLDAAIVFGDITDPFPDASFGYGFIYWIFILTLILNFSYAIAITVRRRQLRAMPA